MARCVTMPRTEWSSLPSADARSRSRSRSSGRLRRDGARLRRHQRRSLRQERPLRDASLGAERRQDPPRVRVRQRSYAAHRAHHGQGGHRVLAAHAAMARSGDRHSPRLGAVLLSRPCGEPAERRGRRTPSPARARDRGRGEPRNRARVFRQRLSRAAGAHRRCASGLAIRPAQVQGGVPHAGDRGRSRSAGVGGARPPCRGPEDHLRAARARDRRAAGRAGA